MPDWIKRIVQYWPALVLGLLMVALLDGVISTLMTCHPITAEHGGGANAQEAKEYCTALHGPILISLRWIAHVAHKYDGLIAAVFTIVLAVFTGTLWWSTDKLWIVATETAEAQARDNRILHRAYIAAIPREIRPYHPVGSLLDDKVACNVELKNVGHLAATRVKIQAAAYFLQRRQP